MRNNLLGKQSRAALLVGLVLLAIFVWRLPGFGMLAHSAAAVKTAGQTPQDVSVKNSGKDDVSATPPHNQNNRVVSADQDQKAVTFAPAAAGMWQQVTNMPTAAYGPGATSDGTYAYVAGGYSFLVGNDVTTFRRYDPATDTWTTLAPIPVALSMSSLVYAPINNKIYLFGGEAVASATVVNSTRIYDIASNTWSNGANMPDIRAFMASGYYNGKIYLVGGYSTGSVTPAFAQVWEYDPLTNTFDTTRNPMPHALGGAGSGVINGHLYVAGGRDAAIAVLDSLYDYDIAGNTWTTRANLPAVTNVPGSGVMDGKLYIFGGGNPFGAFTATRIYDPIGNTWTSGPNLNVGRSFIGGTNVGNTLVAAGGYNGSTTIATTEVILSVAVTDLSITKTDGVTTVTAGGTTTYTITASNAGPGNAPNLTVTDNFPAGLIGVTWTCVGAGGGTCPAGGSGNGNINAMVNLPAGASVTFTATGTVIGNVPGTISNTASITAGGTTDPNLGNNSATDTDTIVCPAVTLSPASLPTATINTAYGQTITAAPAGGNYAFSVTSGLLPAGLTLNSNGSFSGAPTQSGTFNIRVTASGFGGCTGFRDYVLIVECPGVTINPASLPGGSVGTPYSQGVSGSPAGAYSYAVSSGALPPGVMLNASTGGIAGSPTTGGSFTFTITASSGGAGSCTGARTYTVTIACPTITLSPTSPLSSGQAGAAYTQAINVSPAGTYNFSLASGSLPSGLTLNPTTGAISGIPTGTGTFNFTVKAQTDGGCNGTQAYTLAINCPTVTVTPATLPNGTTGTVYSQTVTASPAGGNYAFAVSSGTMPAGLNLNPATGALTGTPTASGSFTFTVAATGWGSCSGSRQYTIVIGGGGCPTIALPASLPNGNVGTLYSNSVGASPAGSYAYTATGTLPPGVALFGAFGLLYGYPTASGSYTFTITATQGACSGSQQYTVLIGAGFASSLRVFSDFDGDGKGDLSVFRGSEGKWLVANSGNGQLQTTPWGAAYDPYNDLAVSGDYDGDGKTDLAVFRRGSEYAGYWFIKRSSDGQVASYFWGLPTDIPVPGDYDADGKTDVAVWRGSDGGWYILRSSDGGVEGSLWGNLAVGDVPVPGDYDGDGKTDVAVFRKSDGYWYLKQSSDGVIISTKWGLGTDVPLPGDYDGDGKTDLAVWRGAEGNWYVLESSGAALRTLALGAAGDVPVATDYDGDGKVDAAVWQAATGTWLVKSSKSGVETATAFGQRGDTPVMARKN